MKKKTTKAKEPTFKTAHVKIDELQPGDRVLDRNNCARIVYSTSGDFVLLFDHTGQTMVEPLQQVRKQIQP